MSDPSSRRNFIVKSTSVATAAAVSSALVACGGSDAPAAEFKYGIASGDPLADRVMLWTHAKIADSTAVVGLTWQVASDSAFASILRSGRIETSEATSFTAKVDVNGLTAGSTYFYRFLDEAGTSSTLGITRTLPAVNAASVKFAVFSCALYSEGFFNTYDAATKSDAQYAIHLGD